jgi:hypothetical protein
MLAYASEKPIRRGCKFKTVDVKQSMFGKAFHGKHNGQPQYTFTRRPELSGRYHTQFDKKVFYLRLCAVMPGVVFKVTYCIDWLAARLWQEAHIGWFQIYHQGAFDHSGLPAKTAGVMDVQQQL